MIDVTSDLLYIIHDMEHLLEEYSKSLGKDMFTPNEAAEILGMTPDHVRQYLRKKLIRGTKDSGSWMISKTEIEKYLRAHPRDDY